MSLKNLALDVESIALALSEEGGYEYYHIDDDLKELAKNVSDVQAENAKLRAARDMWQENDAKLRELVRHLYTCMQHHACATCEYDGDACDFEYDMRELGIEVDE